MQVFELSRNNKTKHKCRNIDGTTGGAGHEIPTQSPIFATTHTDFALRRKCRLRRHRSWGKAEKLYYAVEKRKLVLFMLFTLLLQKLAVFHIRPAYLQQHSRQQLPTHRLHSRRSRAKTAHVCRFLNHPRITRQNTNIEVLIEQQVGQDMKFLPLGGKFGFFIRCQQYVSQTLPASTCNSTPFVAKFNLFCQHHDGEISTRVLRLLALNKQPLLTFGNFEQVLARVNANTALFCNQLHHTQVCPTQKQIFCT